MTLHQEIAWPQSFAECWTEVCSILALVAVAILTSATDPTVDVPPIFTFDQPSVAERHAVEPCALVPWRLRCP
jgi:hypothetical protein